MKGATENHHDENRESQQIAYCLWLDNHPKQDADSDEYAHFGNHRVDAEVNIEALRQHDDIGDIGCLHQTYTPYHQGVLGWGH